MANKNGLIIIIAILLALISMVLFCTTGSDKIPITTSSKEALDKYLKGRDFMERFSNTKAIENLEDAIKIDSQFAMAYMLLAFLQYTTPEYFNYLDKANSLKDIVSEGEKIYISAIQARVIGKIGEQEQLLKELVELYPKDERAHMELANFYFAQQEFEKAIEEYKECLKINYRFSLPYNMMGYSYRNINDYENSEKAFEQYIELIPDDPNPYDSYGELKMRMGKYGESIESYYKALKLSPKFTASHLGIAANLNFLGKHKEARDQLQELYDLADTDDERKTALFGMAVSFVDEGKLKAGIEVFNRRMELSQKTDDLNNLVGDLRLIAYICLELKQPDKAEESYEKSIKVINESNYAQDIKDNSNREIHYFKVQLALVRNDLPTAMVELEEYRKVAKEFASIVRTRMMHELNGMVALYEMKYEEAIKEFELGREQSARNLYRTGLAYEGLGDKAKAIDFFDRAAHFNSTSDINYAFIRIKALEKLKELKS
ncbi:MAG: tetratricopeptide repeat protein [Candidatus Zixiibacteriota bacterium]